MVTLIDDFFALLEPLKAFDWLVFAVNILVFLFARRIVKLFHNKSQTIYDQRLRSLRATNLLLFGLYTVPLVLQALKSNSEGVNPSEVGRQISETTLILLLSYLVRQLLRMFTLKKYGREKEIEGEKVLSDTYQSEMFSLLIWVILVIATVLALINIWQITDWLKATSVFGGLLLIAYTTKEVWAPENINGLILLYNGQVEPGTVVRVTELDLLAVVNQTTLTQTVFRDLRHRHLILVPNSRFRNAKIEVLSNATSKGLVEFVDFKIGYGYTSGVIEEFLNAIWTKACTQESGIYNSGRCRVCIVDNGDHAVTWRLFYTVRNGASYRPEHATNPRVASRPAIDDSDLVARCGAGGARNGGTQIYRRTSSGRRRSPGTGPGSGTLITATEDDIGRRQVDPVFVVILRFGRQRQLHFVGSLPFELGTSVAHRDLSGGRDFDVVTGEHFPRVSDEFPFQFIIPPTLKDQFPVVVVVLYPKIHKTSSVMDIGPKGDKLVRHSRTLIAPSGLKTESAHGYVTSPWHQKNFMFLDSIRKRTRVGNLIRYFLPGFESFR